MANRRSADSSDRVPSGCRFSSSCCHGPSGSADGAEALTGEPGGAIEAAAGDPTDGEALVAEHPASSAATTKPRTRRGIAWAPMTLRSDPLDELGEEGRHGL